jgi:hypothetical protein
MKRFVYILSLLFLLSSCRKYELPTLLSLSGEYVIDKITYSQINNSVLTNDIVYLPGDTYFNPSERFPMDNIKVGSTKWHLDYSVISMCPILTGTGSTMWTKQYYYEVINHNSNYDLGYLDFNCEGFRRMFKIVDDQAESITLRSTGAWGYAQIGYNKSITLHLTRIGP